MPCEWGFFRELTGETMIILWGWGFLKGFKPGFQTTSGSCEAAGFQGKNRAGERKIGVS